MVYVNAFHLCPSYFDGLGFLQHFFLSGLLKPCLDSTRPQSLDQIEYDKFFVNLFNSGHRLVDIRVQKLDTVSSWRYLYSKGHRGSMRNLMLSMVMIIKALEGNTYNHISRWMLSQERTPGGGKNWDYDE